MSARLSFGTPSTIWRLNADGTGLQMIAEGTPGNMYGIADVDFNPWDAHLYWSEHYFGVWRSERDGAKKEHVVGLSIFGGKPVVEESDVDVHAIAFEHDNIYWSHRPGIEDQFVRANLDDTTIQVVPIAGRDNSYIVEDLIIDDVTKSIYWIDTPNACNIPPCPARLQRAAVDANILEPSNVTIANNPHRLALDGNGYLYWSDGGIHRINLDTKAIEQIVFDDVVAFEIDRSTSSIIYSTGSILEPGKLFRTSLSGENTVEMLKLDFTPLAITLRYDVPGDFDRNGVLDANDANLLTIAIRNGDGPVEHDLNDDTVVDIADYALWVSELVNTYIGDADLNGTFTSEDLVLVLAGGEYEDNIVANSGWEEGDWNADGEFNSADLVVALADGGYEAGPRPVAVPESSMLVMLLVGLFAVAHAPRTRRTPRLIDEAPE